MMGPFSSRREDPKAPFQMPREPRPKGAQKGVTKRDNGRPSEFTNGRIPNRRIARGGSRLSRGW